MVTTMGSAVSSAPVQSGKVKGSHAPACNNKVIYESSSQHSNNSIAPSQVGWVFTLLMSRWILSPQSSSFASSRSVYTRTQFAYLVALIFLFKLCTTIFHSQFFHISLILLMGHTLGLLLFFNCRQVYLMSVGNNHLNQRGVSYSVQAECQELLCTLTKKESTKTLESRAIFMREKANKEQVKK